MSDQPIHPEEVFHSALPTGASQVVVFVPSKDRDRQPIDQDHWVDEKCWRPWVVFFAAPPPIPEVEASGATMNVAAR